MAQRQFLGLREIRSMQPSSEIWDSKVTGFGARRQRSEAISYVVMYRTGDGRQRRHTIGRHGAPWTPETARKEAQRILGQVAGGSDPAAQKMAAREAPTVGELCDRYLKDAEGGRLLTRRRAPKKASTLATDKGRVERHIKPVLGRMKVAAVTRDDVEDFMHRVADGETATSVKTKKRGLARVRGGRGASSRTVGLLGAIFTYAVAKKLRTDNPVRGVVRFADGRKIRRLTNEEYEKLGSALVRASNTIWPPAIAATRFLILTGWRSGEALGLRWNETDLDRRTAMLPESKTGASMRPLSKRACRLLRTTPRTGDIVFAASRGEGHMSGFPRFFGKIITMAGLPSDITPHVLRHSFASVAGDLEYSESTIGELLGHRGHSVTRRYIHAADAVLLAAADAVAERIECLMAGGKG